MSRLLHSLPRAAGGRKMDSIVREVVSRSGVQPRLPESPTQSMGVGAEDAELERILASLRTNIKIVGIGGGGCNTIDRLVESGIVGAELFAANTDAQHLLIIRSPHKLLLGRRVTRGLGAGALPQVGEESAREAADELRSVVQGADMVFITCGLGGGTGTGGAPVLAQLSKEAGAPTIAICPFPFRAGGAIRGENAEEAIEEAINSPLIDVDITGATGALVNVTGGNDMSVSEAERVAEIVQGRIAPNARIIWGAAVDPSLEHKLRVMLILTGVRSKQILGPGEHVRAHGGGDIVRGGRGGHRGPALGGSTANRGACEAPREGPLRPCPEDGAPAHVGRVFQGRVDHGPRDRRDRRAGLRHLPDHAIRSRRLPRDFRLPGAVMAWDCSTISRSARRSRSPNPSRPRSAT